MKSKELLEVYEKIAQIKEYHAYNSYALPICQTAMFCFSNMQEAHEVCTGKDFGKYVYTRMGNPTITAVERKLAIWEQGEEACLFSSGMAAIFTTLFSFLKPGDHIICSQVLYSCTDELISGWLPDRGIEIDAVDTSNVNVVKKSLKSNTKAAFIETPTNPTMDCTSIVQFCRLLDKYRPGIIKIIDNTFATPFNQRPLTLGADLVVHSLTKYLSGHGDLIAGATIGSKELMEKIKELAILVGAITTPFNAFLIDRSLEDFPPRMKKHNSNAKKLAEFLKTHPLIKDVYYPAFNRIAKKQMSGYGGMISFEFRNDVSMEAIEKFIDFLIANSGIKLAVSLGDTKTLIEWPARMTHVKIPREEREERGISDSLIRISVGIEEYQLIQRAFKKALHELPKILLKEEC